jgi:hypothetical protein
MKKDLAEDVRTGEMLHEAEAATEELLREAVRWQAAHPRASMEELEVMMLQLRKAFGERLTTIMVQHREAQRPVPEPVCPECGTKMHYKGEKERHIPSALGDIPVERGYYYCSACRQGVFPPGSGVGADGERLESLSGADGDVAQRPDDLRRDARGSGNGGADCRIES